MSEQLGGLLEQLDGDPDDRDTQLVLADHLIAIGDPRGELIALHLADRVAPQGLTDADALERLLLLAATYGFPNARNEDYPPLPWVVSGAFPTEGTVEYRGHRYDFRYRGGILSVEMDGGAIPTGVEYPGGLALGGEYSGELADDARVVLITVLSDAIRAGTPIGSLRFPFDARLPQFPGVPLRVYELPRDYRERHGALDADTYGLAARDFFRWHALWDRLRGIHHRNRT